MKTIIQEGVTAKVIFADEGCEDNHVQLQFQVLPLVGEAIKLTRHGGYFSSTHIVTKIEHEVLISDNQSVVGINIYTTPEE